MGSAVAGATVSGCCIDSTYSEHGVPIASAARSGAGGVPCVPRDRRNHDPPLRSFCSSSVATVAESGK
jgi:hypothetical protein